MKKLRKNVDEEVEEKTDNIVEESHCEGRTVDDDQGSALVGREGREKGYKRLHTRHERSKVICM